MEIDPSIFKAYDIRGTVGTQLTTEVAERVGRGFAEWLDDSGKVAVGWDMRPDSKELSDAIIKGLTEQGRDVISIGLVPSDVFYFACMHLDDVCGSVMITASHNPGKDNGIKLCRRQGDYAVAPSIDSGLNVIRDLAIKNQWPEKKLGKITEKNINAEWIDHVLGFVDPKTWPNYHIAIDAGNGMYGALGAELESRLPLHVEQMYYELDGTFPNHVANPKEPENLKDLIKKINSDKLDFGLAFDGDGDRAVMVDDKGRMVPGTIMMAIIADYLLQNTKNETVIYNAVTGRIVAEVVESHNGKAIREKVGHTYIQEDMAKYKALFGGETSGHFFFRSNYGADSGMIGAVIGIQALVNSGKKLSELYDKYDKYPTINEINFEVDDKNAVLENIKTEFTDGEIDTLDGVSVLYPYGWINVRPSNTEPILRLNAEADTQEQLDELVSRAKNIIVS